MNKLILSSICAAALASTASAFTLDLSSLNGTTLGTGTITNSFGTFTLIGTGPISVSNGEASLSAGNSLKVVYPSTVTYIGAFVTGNAFIDDDSAVEPQTVKYTALENGVGVEDIRFEAVPEPSSTALLGLGGFALILRRRK